MNENIDQLRQHAEEAKVEFDKLQSEIDVIPGQLAEIDNRLKTATDIKTIKALRTKRAELSEDAEIKPLLLRGARVRMLRAQSAHTRALQQGLRPNYQAAVQAERDAKAELEAAKLKIEAATAERLLIERRDHKLNDQWQNLASEADDWERGTESRRIGA